MRRADDLASPPLELRDAVVTDAAALSALNVASWREAYADILPAAFLAVLGVADWEERLRKRIAEADAAQFTLVAWRGRSAVGYVSGGPVRDEPPAAGGEVYAIYVRPDHWGRGVGAGLLGSAEARLTTSGFSRAMLWVFTRNAAARRFYERRGWRLEPGRAYWQRDGLRRQLVCYDKPLAMPPAARLTQLQD